MFCKYCGKQLSERSIFCRFCGEDLREKKLEEGRNNKRSENREEFHAGFWLRFGAYFIDFMGVIIIAFAVAILFTFLGIPDIFSEIGIFADYFYWIVYSTLCLSLWSSTPGKMIYGLTVYRDGEERMEFGSAFKRAVLQPLSMLFVGAGYWNMDKDPEKKAWHDKVAHTYVIGEQRRNYVLPVILSFIGLILYFYFRSLTSTS
jgi:uncharacterized RDD family membrane protein YckC